MGNLKTNILLNGINTATSLLFPIITFPYAARVLLPEGIGTINFLNGIISYIVLFTSLGIPMYAVKEIAKCRDNIKERDKVTVEILILSFALSILGYIGVWILARYVPEVHEQATVFYILSLAIVFNTVGVNWFYQGIEDFKFITVRAIVIRTLAAAALFIFVKSPSDLIAYAFIIVGSTVGNNIINFIHLRTHIRRPFAQLRNLRITRHIRPAVVLFAFNLIVSLYIYLNTVMLGFISGEEQTGYFTAGTRISHIGLTLIASLGTVLLPRCSNLLATGDDAGFAKVIGKSLNLTLGLALPMMCGMMILSRPVTMVFCGPEYSQSVAVLFLNAPVILLVGLTNLMGIQILYPKDKIRIVLWSVAGGAIVNLVLNYSLLPEYGAYGAAIATLLAETTVLVIQVICGRHYFPFRLKELINTKYIIATVAMGLFVWLSMQLSVSDVWHLIISIPVGVLVYALMLQILHESLYTEIRHSILKRFSNA